MTTRDQTRQTSNGQRTPAPFTEQGVQNTQKVATSVYSDFLPQLSGNKASKTYQEMADNDATIGAVLLAMETMLRRVSWTVEPGDETPESEAAALFVEECMGDMSHSWPDFISAVLSMLTFGWSWFEIVYKRRLGEEAEPRSQFDDGRVGWRKLAFRSQPTVIDFVTDEHGGVQGMWQSTGGGQRVFLPIEKSLLFRTTTTRGATGRSPLRTSYRSWFFKKLGEETLMIGVRRNLAGIPKATMPVEQMLAGGEPFDTIKQVVTRLHVDEQAGVTWFSDRDENGQLMYTLDLMESPGTSEAIGAAQGTVRMFAGDIATAMLAGFSNLGRDAVGSRALADPLIDLFRTALEATADMIQETLNRFAVPRLMALNTFGGELPRLVHGELREPDIASIGTFIKDTAGAGLPWLTGDPKADSATMREAREMAGFEPQDVDVAQVEPVVEPEPLVKRGVVWARTNARIGR